MIESNRWLHLARHTVKILERSYLMNNLGGIQLPRRNACEKFKDEQKAVSIGRCRVETDRLSERVDIGSFVLAIDRHYGELFHYRIAPWNELIERDLARASSEDLGDSYDRATFLEQRRETV
ncbi:hypothetical protein [Burkholderia multivorans]|uniref:hypothetical protein n=1 Tax=Burkholderia multivorans TaxID=87883 RepID=UPI0019033B3C|nr:hypothetical protein [Burkholderia multivorans]MBJ9625738.1 hypothetical protein [Burkholderia multivorans]